VGPSSRVPHSDAPEICWLSRIQSDEPQTLRAGGKIAKIGLGCNLQCVEPIVEPAVLEKAQRALQSRTINKSNGKILADLTRNKLGSSIDHRAFQQV
jgi:hypothetical protein